MKVIKQLLCGFVFLSLFSCANKYMSSKVKATEIKEMYLFQPIVSVFTMEKGNKVLYNAAISNETNFNLTNTIFKYKQNLPAWEYFFFKDSAGSEKINDEIKLLFRQMKIAKKTTDVPITPFLDKILETNGKRFGLIIFAEGYSRTQKNYNNELMLGALSAVVFGLGRAYVPDKNYLSLYAIIIDAKENNIAFFNDAYGANRDPLNQIDMFNRVNELFSMYFRKLQK